MRTRMNFCASPRTVPRLVSAVLALVAVAALSPVVACGSGDDDGGTGETGTPDGGNGGGGLDAGSGASDATTGDGSTKLDAAADSATSTDAATDSGSTDGAVSDADAASGPCTPVNGYYVLSGPGAGSASFCPTESGITCHFATESGSCALTSQCAGDSGLPAGFFAIPTGTLDGNDSLSYSATYTVPGANAFSFTASCTLKFSAGQTTATLTCSGMVPFVGTESCGYSGGKTDGGL
jgi:hypothetical protein